MFRSQLFSTKRSVKHRRSSARLAIESLEQRSLMAVSTLFASELDSNAFITADSSTLKVLSSIVDKLVEGPVIAIPFRAIPPALSSNPGAPVTLHLDFDGDFRDDWFNLGPETHYENVAIAAFDTDGNLGEFSDTERQLITDVWRRVADDFAPFNINVTTDDPGNLNNGQTVKVVIGGNNFLGNRISGISSIGSFTDGAPNIVYAFQAQIGNNADSLATTASHEAGHAFGLLHHRRYDANGILVNEYNPGGTFTVPIMGNNLSTLRSQFSLGITNIRINADGSRTTTLQNDLAVLAGEAKGYSGEAGAYLSEPANTFGWRPDDVGNAIGSAKSLGSAILGNRTANGIIERFADVDFYSFTTAVQGTVTVNVAGLFQTANLTAYVELWSAGGRIASAWMADNGNAAVISANLGAGTYYVRVSSFSNLGMYNVNVAAPVAIRDLTSKVAVFGGLRDLNTMNVTNLVADATTAADGELPLLVAEPSNTTAEYSAWEEAINTMVAELAEQQTANPDEYYPEDFNWATALDLLETTEPEVAETTGEDYSSQDTFVQQEDEYAYQDEYDSEYNEGENYFAVYWQ